MHQLDMIKSFWEGPAADAAQRAMSPLADWGAKTGVGNAEDIHMNLGKAAEAAEMVRHMPAPVAPFSLPAALAGGLADSPADMLDYRIAAERAQEVKEEQVRYLEQYEIVMRTVYEALPDFEPPPTAVAGAEPSASSGAGYSYSGVTTPSGGNFQSGSVAPTGTPAAPVAHAEEHRAIEPPARPQRSTTQTTVIAKFLPAKTPGLASVPPVSTAPIASVSGELPAGGFGGGGGLKGGPGEGRANLARGSAPQAPSRLPVTAAHHGTAPAGATGNRPRREADLAHARAAYLVERDPQGLFGTNERTAPPVIG